MQEGKTPLDLARNDEVKALLREHGGKHSFLCSVEMGMLEEVSGLIKEGADVNQQNSVSPACNLVHISCLCVERERARERAREAEEDEV